MLNLLGVVIGRYTSAIAAAVFILACMVRSLAGTPTVDSVLTSVDQSEYLSLAQNIRNHGTFSYGFPYRWGDRGVLNSPGPFEPTAGRAPLYPLVIAALWWGEEPPLATVRLLQVLLGGLVAMLVYLIALRAFGPLTAIFAGFGLAVAPLTAQFASVLQTQVLFTFLLTSALWLLGKRYGFLSGILLGAAALTRSALLPLIMLVALSALAFRFNRGLHLKIVLGAVLVIAPWTARNAATHHAFIPIASMGWGANLFLGSFDTPYGGGESVWDLAYSEGTLTRIVETSASIEEAESRMFEEGLKRIARDPAGWLITCVKQYPRLFLGTPNYLAPSAAIPRWIINSVYFLGGTLFVALSAYGLFLARHRWREVYHLAAFPIFLCIAQFPALDEERYSLDMVPLLMVFAAFAAATLVRRRQETRLA